MYTTGLVIDDGGQRICLYLSGRSHAGENLDALLKQRDRALPAPIVMSDALAANRTDSTIALDFTAVSKLSSPRNSTTNCLF